MYLSTLHIKHFRSISECEVSFSKGLNILVGENNAGKSSIIDALRALLITDKEQGVTITKHDFPYINGSHDLSAPIEFTYTFCDLTPEQQAIFLECLDDKQNVRIVIKFRYNSKLERVGFAEFVCGQHLENKMPSEIRDWLLGIYLQPLRDPTKHLRPSYKNVITKAVHRKARDAEKDDILKKLQELDRQVSADGTAIDAVKGDVSKALLDITGRELKQELDLKFSDPDFERMMSRLSVLVDELDVEQNGLGFNNILYIAALLTESIISEHSFNTLLVEEPEAHLHPQLQTLLLKYLQDKCGTSEDNESNRWQVIVTSHSPIFASNAKLENLITLYKQNSKIHSVSLNGAIKNDSNDKLKNKLRRYLDATKAELFFAKRIIFVEGIAEQLLLPFLAERCKYGLREKSVTIVNVQGINFDCFLPLFQSGKLTIPAAIITDKDPDKNCYPTKECQVTASSTYKKIEESAASLATVKVFSSQKTFEYDLGLESDGNATLLRKVASGIKTPQNFPENWHNLPLYEKNKAFFEAYFVTNPISKGEFALQLAEELSSQTPPAFDVPKYLKQALQFIAGSDESISGGINAS